ncbi:MAG: alginate lyase family protein [Aquihabitans sp.]
MTRAMHLARYVRTLAHLRPHQMLHRARLVVQRRMVGGSSEAFKRRWTVSPNGPASLPREFHPIDATVMAHRWALEDLSQGSLTFLNQTRELGDPVQWDPADASHLWLFHHHYWEWAWSLAADPDRDGARAVLAKHWRGWHDSTSFGRGNAWATYPTSIRAWVLVNVFHELIAGTDIEPMVVADLGAHAGFIKRNLELDIGGNHIIKNLKALVGLGVFLSDDHIVDFALQHLSREIRVQVLADGGHYELSPSYHCQVLGDFIDVAGLLAASGRRPVPELDEAVASMRRWLGLMLMPDGDVPLFNDCEPVGADLLAVLRPGPPAAQPFTVLAESGYVVVLNGPFHLVADVGQPGPPDLPGHIHADCLTFELAVHDQRVVVDSGTSEYGIGPQRIHERSTKAHTTIEIDGTDQTEVWGAFRAGRRAEATLERVESADGTVTVVASHSGYRHLDGRPLHRRTWEVSSAEVRVLDRVEGTGRHRLTARILVPGSAILGLDKEGRRSESFANGPPHIVGIQQITLQSSSADRPATSRWAPSTRARGFGILEDARLLEADITLDLPAGFVTRIVAEPPHCKAPADG